MTARGAWSAWVLGGRLSAGRGRRRTGPVRGALAFGAAALFLLGACGGKSDLDKAVDEADAAGTDYVIACAHEWITGAVLGSQKAIRRTAADCGVSETDAASQEAGTEHLLSLLQENREQLGDERVKQELYKATDELLGWCAICVERLDRYAATLE